MYVYVLGRSEANWKRTEPTRDMLSDAVSGVCEMTNQKRLDIWERGLTEKAKHLRQRGNTVLLQWTAKEN